ncbi:MAG: hypothetical protein ABIA02_00075 [Candidatus Falkowbacteria bacterium]
MDNDYKNQEPDKLSRGQKLATVGLSIFAILIIVMWGAQFKKSINDPFAYKGSESTENQPASTCSGPECNQQTEEDLRAKDTDKDGLSDWDELYFYKTSPYLEDSDSDGFLDMDEINTENDPNCPTGRDCYGSGIIEGDTTVVKDVQEPVSTNISDDAGLEFLLSGDIDATTLRQLLESAGMDKEMLDQFSDAELIASYQETLSQ